MKTRSSLAKMISDGESNFMQYKWSGWSIETLKKMLIYMGSFTVQLHAWCRPDWYALSRFLKTYFIWYENA